MAIGSKYFGASIDPNYSNLQANFTDDTRKASSGGSNAATFSSLSDTINMPNGIYRCRLDFQVYTNESNYYIKIDGGSVITNLGHIWQTGLVTGHLVSRECILKVDKGVGNVVSISYPKGFYGLVAAFEYLGAL